MAKEYELRVLEIDKNEIIQKLKKLNAKKVKAVTMKRVNYDGPREGSFLRLRDEGNKITLTYKYRLYKDSLEDTDEHEITVSDFEGCKLILENMGHKVESFQEQKREEYQLENITYTVDTWPHIPTYLEIEAPSKSTVEHGLELLQLKNPKTTHLAGLGLFELYGFKPSQCRHLVFENNAD